MVKLTQMRYRMGMYLFYRTVRLAITEDALEHLTTRNNTNTVEKYDRWQVN